MEEERVGEEIARKLCKRDYGDNWETLPELTKECYLGRASQILAIKGIRIEADDQSLPEDPFDYASECRESTAYGKAQQDMLKPDSKRNVWVKVLPKKE